MNRTNLLSANLFIHFDIAFLVYFFSFNFTIIMILRGHKLNEPHIITKKKDLKIISYIVNFVKK